jgi:copper chaperone CopZ
MTCSKCEETLIAGLLTCDGVEEAKVSYKESHAVIKVNVFEVDYDNILEVVNGAGFSIVGEE